jgi:hypothetical protein
MRLFGGVLGVILLAFIAVCIQLYARKPKKRKNASQQTFLSGPWVLVQPSQTQTGRVGVVQVLDGSTLPPEPAHCRW